MLRLVNKFDLIRDVFEKIPESVLHSGTEKLTPETSRLAIVGHERTGHLIISYDGFTSVGGPVRRFFVWSLTLHTP
jgi:hypothetical protein